MNSKNKYILLNLLAFEFVLVNLLLLTFIFFRHSEFSAGDTRFLWNLAQLILIYNFSWLVLVIFVRDNDFYFNPDYAHFRHLMVSLFFFVGLATSLVVLLRITYFNRSTFIIPIFIFCYLNWVSHKYLLRFLKKKSVHLFSNTLLLGSGYADSELNGFTNAMTQYGYNIMGYLDKTEPVPPVISDLSIAGEIDDLADVLSDNAIDEIFIATTDLDHAMVTDAIEIADSFGVRVKLIPDNALLMSKNYSAYTLGEFTIYKLRQSPLDRFSTAVLKRMFDIVFAILALILCAPLFLIIAILIKLDSKGPVFYCPIRKGEANSAFRCYKFRTMSVCEDPKNGTKSTVVNDPRITRVGRILRKTDLDELPQFYNVLKGDMSVIGPRPHRVNLQQDFRKSINHYMVRSYVKPGITGWAQVNGWRGPTVTDEQKNERVHHDLWYIEHWSIWLDFKIIYLTIFGSHHKKAF